MNLDKILVGADPEFFVQQNGKFVSAHGLVKGTKEEPTKVERGAVQVDGHALEFNINPAKDEEEFLLNINTVLATLKMMTPDYEHVITPVADFDPAYLASMPEEANELGCDPDYNGWTEMVNEKPNADLPMRTASGHIHIGIVEDVDYKGIQHFMMSAAMAKQLDFYLGLPSLFFDSDTRRREMYGKAGAFRPKPYGMEYRTLSNAWLKSEELIRWAYKNAVEGVRNMFSGNYLPEKYGDIQEIINTSNKKEAERICLLENIVICRG